MLNLNDIVALAKSGYKVDDIKELIKLSKEAETEESKPSGSEEEKEVKKKEEVLPEEEPKKGTVEQPSEDTSKVIDYKKRTEELEEKLQELQKANTKKNMADKDDEKSDLEVFADAMKSFM